MERTATPARRAARCSGGARWPRAVAPPAAAAQAAPPGRLPIGIVSRHLQWTTLEDAIAVAKEAGFDAIEWNVRKGGHVAPERVEQELPRAVELTRKAGLAVTMITDVDPGRAVAVRRADPPRRARPRHPLLPRRRVLPLRLRASRCCRSSRRSSRAWPGLPSSTRVRHDAGPTTRIRRPALSAATCGISGGDQGLRPGVDRPQLRHRPRDGARTAPAGSTPPPWWRRSSRRWR